MFGGLHAGAKVAQVVGVGAVDHDRHVQTFGQAVELGVQLGFAVEAAVRRVALVVGAVHLFGRQHFVANATGGNQIRAAGS